MMMQLHTCELTQTVSLSRLPCEAGMPTVSTTSPSCNSNFKRSAHRPFKESQLQQALLACHEPSQTWRERGEKGPSAPHHLQVMVRGGSWLPNGQRL